MARRGTFALLLASLAACGGTSGSVDSGSGGDGGTAPACGEPDRVCPAAQPFSSAPCEGELHCAYGSAMAHCASGLWTIDPGCDGVGGCVPPLVESCDAPFSGTLSGARVTIGPAGTDRAFAEGELVPVEHGAQGFSMIRFALHVAGVEVPPDCVRAHVSFTWEGMPAPEVMQPMTLHCGDSYPTLQVLPDRPCESREYALTMTVAVDGIGETTASLRMMGGLCPRGG